MSDHEWFKNLGMNHDLTDPGDRPLIPGDFRHRNGRGSRWMPISTLEVTSHRDGWPFPAGKWLSIDILSHFHHGNDHLSRLEVVSVAEMASDEDFRSFPWRKWLPMKIFGHFRGGSGFR
jgi:hypothetical protein